MNEISSDYNYLFNVLKLASVHHASQKRKSDNLPYVNHLIDVADILIEFGNVACEDEIAGALLHDILEGTDLEMKALESQVSEKTLSIVLSLTDDKAQPLEQRRNVSIRTLTLADNATKRVKLADMCSNVTAPPLGWPKKRLHGSYRHSDAIAEICKDASLCLFNEYQNRRLIFC
jgi:guanosine-3',5'-bis(diphosphate) 3'-pyrophosphohydrolase